MTRPAFIKRGYRTTAAESAKRAKLNAEIQQLLDAPLIPGVRLSKDEREREAERVRAGICRQTFHARGASVRSGDN
jgi:hypothetical protein